MTKPAAGDLVWRGTRACLSTGMCCNGRALCSGRGPEMNSCWNWPALGLTTLGP